MSSYSIRDNHFVSHLQHGRTYAFHDSQSKRVAFEAMTRDDLTVRSAAQQRASENGVTKPLSDREIIKGDFLPDRSTTVEKIAEATLKQGVKHDPFSVAVETVRSQMRSTDSASVREKNEATIARLQVRSAELAQARAAAPPVAEPTGPESTASALRLAAEQLRPLSPLPEDQAQYRERKQRLLDNADEQDAKAVADSERAAAVEKNAPWVTDAETTLFRIAGMGSVPQEIVNGVKEMRDKLANLETDSTAWIAFANRVDEQLKEIKAAKIAAKNQEIKTIEAEKNAIRDDEPPAPTVTP